MTEIPKELHASMSKFDSFIHTYKIVLVVVAVVAVLVTVIWLIARRQTTDKSMSRRVERFKRLTTTMGEKLKRADHRLSVAEKDRDQLKEENSRLRVYIQMNSVERPEFEPERPEFEPERREPEPGLVDPESIEPPM